MIDSLQSLTDSAYIEEQIQKALAEQQFDPFKLQEQIHNYYDDAFNNLIIYSGVVIVIVPILFTLFQSYNLKLKKKELKKEFDEKLEQEKEELKKDNKKEIDGEIEKMEKFTLAVGRFVEGAIDYELDNYQDSLRRYLSASKTLFNLEKHSFSNLGLGNIVKCINNMDEDATIEMEVITEINDFISQIEKSADVNEYYKSITKLKEQLKLN